MNRICKTIDKALTGESIVVSESAKYWGKTGSNVRYWHKADYIISICTKSNKNV